jgi:hypothetical protein
MQRVLSVVQRRRDARAVAGLRTVLRAAPGPGCSHSAIAAQQARRLAEAA